jgi:hypothetical protein
LEFLLISAVPHSVVEAEQLEAHSQPEWIALQKLVVAVEEVLKSLQKKCFLQAQSLH